MIFFSFEVCPYRDYWRRGSEGAEPRPAAELRAEPHPSCGTVRNWPWARQWWTDGVHTAGWSCKNKTFGDSLDLWTAQQLEGIAGSSRFCERHGFFYSPIITKESASL